MPLIDDPGVTATPITNPPLNTEFNFPRTRVTPGWNEVLNAEFETNNTVGSVMNYESGPFGHRFDPDFNLAEALAGTRWENNPGLFVTARNRNHFDALVRDHERDERNRQILHDSTWGQWLPAMIIGQAMDPVNWLSLGTVGALRLAANAGRGLTLGTRTAAIAGGVAADTALQEVILRGTQVNRTAEETLGNIGGSLILGGLIGHVGSRLLLRSEMDALSSMIEREVAAFERGELPPRGDLTGLGSGVGAQRVYGDAGTISPTPEMRFSFGADYLSRQMGPQQRLVHSASDVARRFADELIEMPYFFKGHREGHVSAPRGDALSMPGAVQTRIGLWEEPVMRAIYGMRDLYLQYRGADHQNFAQRAAMNVADRFGQRNGAMSEVEFRRAVWDAVNSGGAHSIPQVSKAAQQVLAVIKQVEDAGRKAGVLKEGQTAVPRSWLTREIIRQKPKFKDLVLAHLRRRRSQFEGDWQKIEAERAVRAAEKADASDDARVQREIDRERDKAAREAERAEPLRYTGLPLRDEEVDVIVGDWDYIRRTLAEKPPESLTSFVVRGGGVEDPGGDVLSMLGSHRARPGLVRKGPEQAGPGMAGLGERGTSGITLDDWALRAWEHGFFPDHLERPTIDEFLDKLGDDLMSGNVVRADDLQRLDDIAAAREMERVLQDDYGIAVRQFQKEVTLREFFGQRRAKGTDGAATAAPAARTDGGGAAPAEAKLTAEQERTRHRALMEDTELRDLADTVITRMTMAREGRTAHDLHTVRDPEGFIKDDALLGHEDFALPYNEVRDFLELDADMMLRLMHRSMVPDIEISARFGAADAGPELRARIDEGTRRINAARAPKEREKLQKALDSDLRDMIAARDRLNGRYGIPEDPAHWAVRAGRFARDASVVQKMGMSAFASVAETARLIVPRGISAIFGDLIYPMVANWSKFIEAGHDLRMATHALDHHSASRAMAIADGAENWGNLPTVDRFSREATKTFMRATGLPKLTDWQKSASGMLVSKSILEAAEATRAGTATRKQTEMLSRLAISRQNAIAIAEQFNKHGIRDDARIWAAEANKWDEGARHAREAFLGGIRREVNRLITTPGLDTPNVMASETGALGIFGKMLFQYKNFAISSYERVLVSGLQQNDIAFWSSVVASVGLAFLVNEGRKAVFGQGGDPRHHKSFDRRWNDPKERNQMFIEAVDRAGVLGWLPDANQVADRVFGMGIASNFGALHRRPGIATVGDAERQMAGAPITGAYETGLTGAKLLAHLAGSRSNQWREADTRTLERVVPFVGLHWMRLGLEQLGAEEAINRALGARRPR